MKMINATKAREITFRARHNLYDEQLRTLFECVEAAAEDGKLMFKFTDSDCQSNSLNYEFWFEGARFDTDYWKKVVKCFSDLGYGINYVIQSYPQQHIIVSWG
jgi:hypothetical protein